jgi:23S rRNA (adenine2503-C2)-methyltransferase
VSITLKDIRSFTKHELEAIFKAEGQQAFRGRQVYEWLWKKQVTAFDEMTSLPLATREWLKQNFTLHTLKVEDRQISSDGTIKCTFRLHDGHLIEGVLIPTETRMTACVSSQVGCSLTCKFCATGKMDRIRNLEPGEIFDQVVYIRKQAVERYQTPLTNIVFMGMGEPLLNYSNVLKSIDKITSPDGLHMASDRITVSTAGIAKMIKKLADDQVKFNLALSLHAANDIKRNQIMPINESNSLESLIDALKYFQKHTGKRVTFEYIAFNNFNIEPDDARQLLAICKKVHAKVNIIEYNPIGDGVFDRADANRTNQFQQYLEKHGVVAKIRRSRGKDIDAACGQLANKKHEEALLAD